MAAEAGSDVLHPRQDDHGDESPGSSAVGMHRGAGSAAGGPATLIEARPGRRLGADAVLPDHPDAPAALRRRCSPARPGPRHRGGRGAASTSAVRCSSLDPDKSANCQGRFQAGNTLPRSVVLGPALYRVGVALMPEFQDQPANSAAIRLSCSHRRSSCARPSTAPHGRFSWSTLLVVMRGHPHRLVAVGDPGAAASAAWPPR